MKKKKMSFKILENSDKNTAGQLSEHFSLTEAERERMFRRSMNIYSGSTEEKTKDEEQVIQVKHYRTRGYLKYSAAAVFVMAGAVGLALNSRTYTENHNADKKLTEVITLPETTSITEKETETETSVQYTTEIYTSPSVTSVNETSAVTDSQEVSHVISAVSVNTPERQNEKQSTAAEPEQTLRPEDTITEPPVTTVSETLPEADISEVTEIPDSKDELSFDEDKPVVFSFTDASVKPGETFFINVAADSNAVFSAFQLYFEVDEDVFTVESVSAGSYTDETGYMIAGEDNRSCLFLSTDGYNVDMNGKTVLRIELKVNPDAAEGRYTIAAPVFSQEGCSRFNKKKDKQENAVLYCNPGTISVTS